jgi:hypothetical protein
MSCIHIPISAIWSQTIDRRINYVENTNTITEDGMVNIELDLRCSVNAIFTKAPKAIIYENYFEPFSLQMKVNLLDRDVDKIVLKECFMNTVHGEFRNILEVPIENIDVRFTVRSNDGKRGWGRDYKQFDKPIEILLDKKENEFIERIYVYISDIPIMYESDTDISIIYEIEIHKGNEIIAVNNEISYIRKIEEMKMYHPFRNRVEEDDWHEISMEEWKKGLSFPVMRYYYD